MVSFKGAHFLKDVIPFAVLFYVRSTVWCRDVEEVPGERGMQVDHASPDRWIARHAAVIAANARRQRALADRSWRIDKTCIRVKGARVYRDRTVARYGQTLMSCGQTYARKRSRPRSSLVTPGERHSTQNCPRQERGKRCG